MKTLLRSKNYYAIRKIMDKFNYNASDTSSHRRGKSYIMIRETLVKILNWADIIIVATHDEDKDKKYNLWNIVWDIFIVEDLSYS